MREYMPSRQAVGSFATGAAWFFIVVSLAHLAWVFWALGDSPGGTAKLYHSVVNDQSYDGWALTYRGGFGLVLASVQALAVLAAAIASTLRSPRANRPRRLGHVVLCTWAGLWAANLLWLASVDHQLDSYAQAGLVILLAAATGVRAVRGWAPRVPGDRGPSAALGAPHADDIPAPEDDSTASFFQAIHFSALRPVTPQPPAARTIRQHISAALRHARAALLSVWRWLWTHAARAVGAVRRGAAVALNRLADSARRGANRVAPVSSD